MIKPTKLGACLIALVAIGCLDFFSPTIINSPGSIATATNSNDTNGVEPNAKPTPVPGCEATCDIDQLRFDGSLNVLAVGEKGEFPLTPYTLVAICDASGRPTGKTSSVKTAKDCDDKRADEVVWTASSTALTNSSFAYRGEFTRIARGDTTIKASLQGKFVERLIK